MPRTHKAPVFNVAHYRIIAAEIRELLGETLAFYSGAYPPERQKPLYYATDALVRLASHLAKRFKEDNPLFDPLKFLDACSPNTELYPLSELWADDSST